MLKITKIYPINIKIWVLMKATLKSLYKTARFPQEDQKEFLKKERDWWNQITPFQKHNTSIPNINNHSMSILLITKVVYKIKIKMKIKLIILIKLNNKKNHHSIINCCQIFLTKNKNIRFPIFLIDKKNVKDHFQKVKRV